MSRVIVILLCSFVAIFGAAAHAAPVGEPVILVYGDSLSAGYGIAVEQGWVNLLSQRLRQSGYGLQVANASVSGETTTGGLARLPRALAAHDPRIVILELGANDGLRGLPPAELKKNLAAIIERAQAKKIAVLLTGMEAPPNFGPDYTVSFRQVYRDLAREYHVALLPFLLDKVAGIASLNQGDGIHPNVDGAQIVADNVWSALKPIVDATAAQ